nr:MAG TPA: hypothetical protein [Caudoviricetes sp.]
MIMLLIALPTCQPSSAIGLLSLTWLYCTSK